MVRRRDDRLWSLIRCFSYSCRAKFVTFTLYTETMLSVETRSCNVPIIESK